MSSITVCFPEQIVVSSMLSTGVTGRTAVICLVLCNTSFCFNFLLLYPLFHFLCIYFLAFTVFIFRHCLLTHLLSVLVFFIYIFSSFSFSVHLSFSL